MMLRRVALAILAAAGLVAAPQISMADMGKAPAGPKEFYLSFEGGFLYHDGGDINGHGIVVTAGDPVKDVKVSADDGYFVGGLIGYENGTPFIFGFHRLELYALFGESDDSAKDSAPPKDDISLTTVDGATFVGTGGLTGKTTTERSTWEIALRLEDDDRINSTTTVTWVLAPFVRSFEEDTDTVVTSSTCCGGCCDARRSGDVDTTLYGIYVAAEPEHMLSSNLTLVGRIGAGIYGYDGDGKFRSSSTSPAPDFFAAAVNDDDSGVGFRGLLGIGLKLKITQATFLEGFAEADYFSKVGTADISTNNRTESYVSYVDDDDLWEVRTGLRLTVGLGGGGGSGN